MKLASKLVVAALAIGALVICWDNNWGIEHNTAALLPDGKAAFYKGKFLRSTKYDLYINKTDGEWYISNSKEFEFGQLAVPFECRYNDTYQLRFENHGKVFWIRKDLPIREELKVVGGDWSFNASDHWQSLFDYIPDD